MIIKLFQPPTRGWLLIAEQLDDPSTWDRFVPSHSATSDRARFGSVVIEIAGSALRLKPCKELLKRGTSVFEYDWEIEEGDVLGHAIEVAEALGLELFIEAPAPQYGGSRRSAA